MTGEGEDNVIRFEFESPPPVERRRGDLIYEAVRAQADYLGLMEDWHEAGNDPESEYADAAADAQERRDALFANLTLNQQHLARQQGEALLKEEKEKAGGEPDQPA